MRKKVVINFFPIIFLVLFLFACQTDDNNTGNNTNNSNDNNSSNNDDSGNDDTPDNGNTGEVTVRTGKVRFFNESSHRVVVHQDAFSGPVLLELSEWETKTVDIRASDNYGVGTTFSIEYLFRINEVFDTESGDVIASGIDPNVQLNLVIKENKSCTVLIPQPQNLEIRSAFIKILNNSSLQFELGYMGTVFKQTGNDHIPVPPEAIGIYKLEGIPSGGKLYENYTVVSTFQSTAIPAFEAENGYIYSCIYDGSSVTTPEKQKIILN